MNKEIIKKGLENFDINKVDNYLSYLKKLETDERKNKDTGKMEKINPWMFYKTDEDHINNYKKIASQGLDFDGKHISLQSTGVAFDYIALKNKMLMVYPESLIDLQLVYNGDEFDFAKSDGKVLYKHKIANPFSRDEKDIIGGYCVIKNKRGEFLTTLNVGELEKHRRVAKTDNIWKMWFTEMAMKTIIKKAVKIHFDDIYKDIIEIDNDSSDLENIPDDLKLSWKIEIDEINTIENLKTYYIKNKGKGKDFDKYISMRKKILLDNLKKDENP